MIGQSYKLATSNCNNESGVKNECYVFGIQNYSLL